MASLEPLAEQRNSASGHAHGGCFLSRQLLYALLPYDLAARLYIVVHTLFAWLGISRLLEPCDSAERGRSWLP